MPPDRLNLPPVDPEMLSPVNPFAKRAEAVEDPGPLRIGELSRRSGIAVGTIKYYLREGLLPAGRVTSKTQALYDGGHLRRLRLIRVLADVGDLSIAEIKTVTGALDDDGTASRPGGIQRVAGYAIGHTPTGEGVPCEDPTAALDPAPAPEDETSLASARAATDAFVDALGFQVESGSPARAELADALHALRTLGFADNPLVFYEHARLAYELGSFEIEYAGASDSQSDPSVAVEAITVGSIVFGAAFMALRRMTHEHETRRRLGA